MKGTVFIRPHDLVGVDPARQYYHREIFATERCETIPLARASGKCVVLSVDDYASCKYCRCLISGRNLKDILLSVRPTEIREQDVFVSEMIVRIPTAMEIEQQQQNVEAPTFLQFPMPVRL